MATEDFQPTYELIDADSEILREELDTFSFVEPPVDPIEFAHVLTKHMLHYGGIGLAANQLGLPYRVFAIKSDPIMVCYNPVLVDATTNEIALEEGCLTFPDLIFKVKRPESIKMRYQQPNGEIVTNMYTGMTARVMQHELDHLDGVLFIDRVSNLVLDMARKKARKYGRK